MLILSRKKAEEVIVTIPPSDTPRQVVFQIVEIRGDKVRTGWKADKDVTIHRAEIQNKIDNPSPPENSHSQASTPPTRIGSAVRGSSKTIGDYRKEQPQ